MIYFVVKSIPHVSVFSFSSFQLKLKWKSTIRPGVSSFHLTDKGYQFKQFINTQEYINLSMSQTKMRGKLPNKCLASPPIFLHLFPTVKQNKFSFFRHCFLHDSHPSLGSTPINLIPATLLCQRVLYFARKSNGKAHKYSTRYNN